MQKTLKIGGKDVRFESNALTPHIYKSQFGRDYMVDIARMSRFEDFTNGNLDPAVVESIDFEFLTNLAWACAKSADENVPDLVTWLRENKEFNRMTDGMEVVSMVTDSISTEKK